MGKQDTVRIVLPRRIVSRGRFPKITRSFVDSQRRITIVEYLISSVTPDGMAVYMLNESTTKGIHNLVIQEGTKCQSK